MAAGDSAVITCYVVNIATCIICFVVFSFLRVSNQTRKFYAPRRYAKDIRLKPRRLPPSGFLSWVLPVWWYPEGEIIDEAGLDAAMYLRVTTFGLRFFFFVSVWCLIVVLPVNLSGHELRRLDALSGEAGAAAFTFVSFDRCSLSNVTAGSGLLWVHMLSVYVVTIIALTLLWRFNKESVRLRVMFLAHARPGGSSHTVLVTDIPGIALPPREGGIVDRVLRWLRLKKSDDSAPGAIGGSPVSQADLDDGTDGHHRGGEEEGAEDGAPPAGDDGEGGLHPPAPGADAAAVASAGYAAAALKNGSEEGAGRAGREAPPSAGGTGQYSPPAPVSDWQHTGSGSAGGVGEEEEAVEEAADEGDAEGAFVDIPLPGDGPGAGAEPPADPAPHSGPLVKYFGPGPVAEGTEPTPAVRPRSLLQPPDGGSGGNIVNPMDVKLDMAAEAHASASSLSRGGVDVDGVRRRRSYNVRDPTLDAQSKAVSKLSSGMSAKGLIESEFRGVYPEGAVVAVNTVNDQSTLEPLVIEYDTLRQKLDDYLDECNFRMSQDMYVQRKQVLVLGSMGDWGKARGYGLWNKPDAIEHWTARLNELSRLINRKQEQCRTRATNSAFVTFSTRVAQCSAAASLHYHDETCWRTQPAPEPFELLWCNLSMRLGERTTRQMTLLVVFFFMTLFFMIPVTAIQAVINIPNLGTTSVLAHVLNAPVIKQLREAIVPGLVLVIFLKIVPAILAAMMVYSGAISASQVDFGVVTRYFFFQVVVVFFFNVIGGSVFSSLQQWIKNPSSAITILGTSIPVVSTFFITYILINGVGGASISLLRVFPLVLNWLFTRLASSPKAQQRLWSFQYTTYGASVSNHTMTILLGTVYCLINPIICPTVLLHFAVNCVIERYQNIYVWRRNYESGGRMWRSVFNQVMSALYLFQLCMLGLLGIKKFKYAPLLVPVIVATVLYHLASSFLFSRPWTLNAQHNAAELDRSERDEGWQKPRGAVVAGAQRMGNRLQQLQHFVQATGSSLMNSGRDLPDSADPDGADGAEEALEPVEIAYLSKVFKVELPADMDDLMREAEATAARIAAQAPPLTKEEAKARKKAATAAAKVAAKERRLLAKGGVIAPAETQMTPSGLPLSAPGAGYSGSSALGGGQRSARDLQAPRPPV